MLPSVAELVAQYLRANGYTKTLTTFIQEAELPLDVGATFSSQVTIEQILQEKKTFDLSLNFEKLGVEDRDRGWRDPAPSNPRELALPTRSNVLSVTMQDLVLPSQSETSSYIAVTTADRRLHLLDPSSPFFSLARSYSNFQDSPILDLMALCSKYLLVASMSGKLLLFDTASDQVIDERKDHSKYLVKLASWSDGSSILIASVGWDAKVFLYRINTASSEASQLGSPIATITLPSIPEVILFVRSPDASLPVLVVSRRDSTFLYYYEVPGLSSNAAEIKLFGKQNLAPHSNAWVAFTPADVQICPADPSLVAVATSSTPHMKLIIVKLLIPPRDASLLDRDTGVESGLTQASQARTDILRQDREEAAIVVNISTMAPQTAYSTPRLVWRPDGSGVYVTSDDGVVRGFEANTGKLVASLEAHDTGSKLRCLWAGSLKGDRNQRFDNGSRDEFLISGGFDQRLILWSS